MDSATTAALLISLLLGVVSPFLLKFYPKLKDEAEAIFVLVASAAAAVVITYVVNGQHFDLVHIGGDLAGIYALQQAIFSLIKRPAKLNAHYPGNRDIRPAA